VTTPPEVSDDRFAIIYRELRKAEAETDPSTIRVVVSDVDLVELRAIDELRRFAMEVANPNPGFYTST
jgi:hypothetical protein